MLAKDKVVFACYAEAMKMFALIAALLLNGCDRPVPVARSDVGRFQVEQVGKRTILIDTDKGVAWELIETENGATRGWVQIKSAS